MNRLYLLPFLFALSCAELILYEAGENPVEQGPIDGATVCPTDFANGITIRCTDIPGAKYANFSVDGVQVRQEKARPYYIAGDVISTGYVKPWTAPFGETVEISCDGSNGLSHMTTVTFFCQPGMSPEPEPTPMTSEDLAPSTMIFVEAGRNGQIGPVIEDGLTFCPDIFPSGTYSIFCQEAPDSAKARFFIDGMRVKTDASVPFYINRDFDGRVRPWTAPKGYFEVACGLGFGVRTKARIRVSCDLKPEVTDGPIVTPELMPPVESTPEPMPPVESTPEPMPPVESTPEPMPSVESTPGPMPPSETTPEPMPMTPGKPMIKTKTDGCILIDSRASPLSEGWKETDEGVVFRENDSSLGIEGKGDFPLEYKFTPPVTSHYAVVVDMTTKDSKDYNDIWIKVDGDFNLYRKSELKAGEGDGWIKGYHNFDGRAAYISSIDFDAHSISTRMTLQEGVEYTFGVSGRSNMVEVHRIILFPCGQGESICQRGDQTWKDFMASCAGETDP